MSKTQAHLIETNIYYYYIEKEENGIYSRIYLYTFINKNKIRWITKENVKIYVVN